MNKDKLLFEKVNILPIDIGAEIQLQLRNLKYNIKSYFTGMVPEKCIIIQYPEGLFGADVHKALSPSGRIIIRYLHKGIAYGFESDIISLVSEPLKLLCLSYPDKIVQHELRNAYRINSIIAVHLDHNGNAISGIIRDISKIGSRIMIEQSAAADTVFKVGEKVNIAFTLPNQNKTDNIKAIIKNIQKNKEEIFIGLMFDNTGPDQGFEGRLFNSLMLISS